MPAWALVVAATALLQLLIGLAVYLSGQTHGPTPLPLWLYAVLATSFGATGSILIAANRSDVRAAWLGAVLLLIGLQSAGPFLGPLTSAVDPRISRIRTDAFLPAFLWFFVANFPSLLTGARRRLVQFVTALAVGFGIAALLINLSILIVPFAADNPDWRVVLAVGRTRPGSLYWGVMFAFSVLAIGALLARVAASSRPDRFRTKVFGLGLAAGVLPFFIEVVLEEIFPAFKRMAHQPGIEPWIAAAIFVPMTTVPFTTAYSVIYDRVVELRIVVRAAIQYALARWVIGTATLIPVLALLIYLYQHRAEPLAELLIGTRPLVLGLAMAAGAVSFRERRRWLHAIDRRFFREAYDTGLLMTNLMNDALITQPPREMAMGLAGELDRTMHVRADLFVLDDDRVMLEDPRGTVSGLPVDSVLVGLAVADPHPMDVRPDDHALTRLPPAEREWLARGAYRLLLALRGRTGLPIGLLALGEKRSGLAFSPSERRSIGALAGPLTLALENERLRRVPDSGNDEAGRECPACARLHAASAVSCICGGTLVAAQAPHMLRGSFKFEQRVGEGGMGVVYRATDLNLGRAVAIKTLPRVTSERVARLRREAKAMATLNHPNLAVIYGIETWRGVPFLVAEYLEGGMLSQRLRADRPMAVVDAIDLSVTLAGVAARLHEAGIIHCDIKPSNVGFTQDGTVKLLDFGLAYLLREPQPLLSTVSLDRPLPLNAPVLSERGLAGTPPYMSPEASRGARPTPAVDLWSLTVVLFEMITGRRPFAGETSQQLFESIRAAAYPDPRTLRGDCPECLAPFFARAFAPDVASRFPSAAALRQALLTLRSQIA